MGGPNTLSGPNRNPPNYTILDNWVSENVISADKPFAKALQIFGTCVLVNSNLCGKLVLSLERPINLMKDLKLLQFQFWFQIFTY